MKLGEHELKAEIVADRKKLKNHNTFFIGKPGSGKVKSCITPNDKEISRKDNPV